MATKKQASERVIDLILDLVIKNEGLDTRPIPNRFIDNNTGQVVVTTDSSDTSDSIVYSADYRQTGFSSDLIQKVDAIVEGCLRDDAQDGGYILLQNNSQFYFNRNDRNPESEVFSETLPDGTYGYDSWISFTPSDGSFDDGSHSNGSMSCEASPGGLRLTTDVLGALTQFIPFNQQQTIVDTNLAKEVLDTNIYELLPGQITRQQRIAKLFSEFEDLIGPNPTNSDYGFDFDGDGDSIGDTWDDLLGGQSLWHQTYGIKPDVNPNQGNIIRLETDAEIHGVPGQSLQSMRNIIDDYLRDVDYQYQTQFEDDRPEQEVGEQGYLQIRHMNQSIIVRNEEDKDLGIVGENVVSPNWLTRGFSIAMWVRFLTKTKGGTLFNFGNPIRNINPYGFRFETFTVNQDEYDLTQSSLPADAFVNDSYERFLRLVVYEPGVGMRDSHFGTEAYSRIDTVGTGELAFETQIEMAFNYTRVPINFKEWYYVVATYNPNINEDESFDNTEYSNSSMFWQNHINPQTDTTTSNSLLGAKCKVEFISKSDLARARSFKV